MTKGCNLNPTGRMEPTVRCRNDGNQRSTSEMLRGSYICWFGGVFSVSIMLAQQQYDFPWHLKCLEIGCGWGGSRTQRFVGCQDGYTVIFLPLGDSSEAV